MYLWRSLAQLLLLLVYLCHRSSVNAQDLDVSPDKQLTVWYPAPQGPNRTPLQINVIDTLVMSYESKWQNVNASMWCCAENTVEGWSNETCKGTKLNNPLVAIGNYLFYNLTEDVPGSAFPMLCHFAFSDTNNELETYEGGTYRMVSTAGPAVTRSYAPSASVTTGNGQGTQGTPTSTGSLQSDQGENEQASSHLLSKVNKIVIIVVVIVFGLSSSFALGFFIMRRRKQRKAMENENQAKSGFGFEPKPEIDSRQSFPELGGSGASEDKWQGRRELST